MTRISEIDSEYVDNRLVQLHVEIARRADELARHRSGPRTREVDLQYWLEAEREVLEHTRDNGRPRLAS